MKSLRSVPKYNIGLDIGTGSVGWAATDENGELCSFKSKPTWGSRIFPSAQPASEARIHRGQRRRYDRRRQRLDLLQMLFAKEMEKVDADFFIRMNQSRLLEEDRGVEWKDCRWPFFNDSDFTEADYFEKFPTIYHLRAWLMEANEKADIRLIYLAFHNIVKVRGNFLYQDNPGLSAANASISDSVQTLCNALIGWCDSTEIALTGEIDDAEISATLEDSSLDRSSKQKRVEKALCFPKEEKKAAAAISKLIIGYKAELADIFHTEPNESNFYLSDDEKTDAFKERCPDNGAPLFDAMLAVHSALILLSILKGATGKTISYCKIAEYEKYAADLRMLKDLVKEYAPDKYDSFFRGEKIESTGKYAPSKAQGYTKYNLDRSQRGQDEFFASIAKLFKETAAIEDVRYKQMQTDIANHAFLERLKTSNNGVIPYQLHLEEMHAIIEMQKSYYPFLTDEYNGTNKIESLVTFRIPYYVGPLTQKNARKNSAGQNRFAWSERMPGMENAKIYPWNWTEVIDRDKSAENFMNRMIGTCTYLTGEQVLPRCSLTYEMFCVLNELAGARWSNDGDKTYRFDAADRMDIVDEVFKKYKTVTYKRVVEWLEKHGHFGHIVVEGAQGTSGFESKLSSYIDFCRLLDVGELSDADIKMAEDIILWNTLFEDRDILKRKIKAAYGDKLNDKQVRDICKKRYTGWGRLSKKLLTGIKTQTCNGPMTIMDLLVEGDIYNDKRVGSALTFMEILTHEQYSFQSLIDEANGSQYEDNFVLEEMPGSPAIRRSVNQALRIVEEIVSIAGKRPENIYIEETRDPLNAREKGRRTQRRLNTVKQALEAIKNEDKNLWNELSKVSQAEFSDRMELYFRQRGKCMYCGKSLDIRQLATYHIDHIIPQSYIKDDSIENKVLVHSECNERKSDSLLIDENIRRKQSAWWRDLYDAGLIGKKKYNNLMRSSISDKQLKGFIARQIVETSQVVKAVRNILADRYKESSVVPVKAALSSQLRESYGFVKCREVNDFHHAHDAYLACEMGRFLQYRYGEYLDNPVKMAHVMKSYVRTMGELLKNRKNALGSAGFFVDSFSKSGFDPETGEVFKDAWNAETEIGRMARYFGYKSCFISRMPEETSGAFWDATVYSPHDTSKALSLPLKKGLAVSKYGSYSGNQFAYFFLFRSTNAKGKSKYHFEGLPISLAAAIKSGNYPLEEYAATLAGVPASSIEILKPRILKYQKIEYMGDEFYLAALKEVRSATPLILSSELMKIVVDLSDEQWVPDSDLNKLYEELANKGLVLIKKFSATETVLKNGKEQFLKLEFGEKRKLLLSIVAYYSGSARLIDLSALGGSKNAGAIKNGSIVNDVIHLTFIDSSVTGMFERRYKLGV